jgi:hypothetical protein
MSALLEALRSGSWLTRERTRLIAFAVLFASVVGLGFILATSDGLNDYQGRPLGTDFSNVYAAGTYVLDGKAAAPFDPPQQFEREKKIFGQATQFYGWHYPPFFLFIAAALALMPYVLALAVWQAATFALYLVALRAVLTSFLPSPLWGGSRIADAKSGEAKSPHPTASRSTSPTRGEVNTIWLLFAVAYPAVFVNIGHGHNGFLTAALIALALVQLNARPILAGLLFGLLAYKPQFGLLIPLALIAGGYWRAFASAAATVIALAIVTTLAFGFDIWSAFLASTHFTRVVVLEQGDTGWHKIQSIFSWARMWGASIPLAYAIQGIATLAIAASLAWLWRSEARFALKGAALVIAAILATPYSLDYDFVILAPAIAFVAADGFERGFLPWEKSALALLWLMPLVARSVAQQAMIPLGVIAMSLVFILILRRAMHGLGFLHAGRVTSRAA